LIRRGEVDAYHLVFDDPDSLKQFLKQHPADRLRGSPVELFRVAQQQEHRVDTGLEVAESGGMAADYHFGCCQLTPHLSLFRLQLIDAHRVGEVGVLDLLTAAVQLVDPTLLQPDLALACGRLRAEVLDGDRPYAGLAIPIHPQPAQVAEYGVLDPFDAGEALGAARGVLLATQTVEVGVMTACPAACQHDPDSAAAAAAAQHCLERMGVLLRLVFGAFAAGQDVLDGLERHLVYQGLVSSGVLHPSEGHRAEVVAVP
jgi:hypothetical protein